MVFGSGKRHLVVDGLHQREGWEMFFTRFNRYLNDETVDQLTLDLRRVEFMMPEMVIVLVSAARLWRRQRGHQLRFDFKDDVQAYLMRMNIFDECQDCIMPLRHVSEKYDRTLNSGRLMEITRISSDEADNARNIAVATGRAHKILRNADVPSERASEIAKLLSEIGQNVIHSGDQGYAIIQRYFIASQHVFRVHIAVGDLGEGIQQTLSRRYSAQQLDCRRGSDYLVRALERRYSSRPSVQGGAGLAHIREVVTVSGGVLIIRSGSSCIWVSATETHQSDDLAHVPGVQVFISAYGAPAEWQ